MSETIEGRCMLYNFDFLKYRDRRTEGMDCPAPKCFHLQGVCWKSRFPAIVKVFVNGQEKARVLAGESADAYPLPNSELIAHGAIIRIEVISIRRRWFRRNTTRVTLEGLEQ